MDRRRFVKTAGWGTAGLLFSSLASMGQAEARELEPPVIPQTAWGRVFIRWTEPRLPHKILPAHGLVLSWSVSPTMLESARKQGYRVYAAVTPAQATEVADHSHAMGLSGIIVEAADSEQDTAEKVASELRQAHPDLTVLSPDPRAKQPAMMGSTLITRQGIMQISSPTEQPWIDSNLALVAFDRAFRPAQTPLIDFRWELPDALQHELGPSTEDYSLAVAEAGALHSDLILNLHPRLQSALASGSNKAWNAWNRVTKFIEFYLSQNEQPVALQANVGVVTDNYDAAYEPMNLMARHNIPFRVLSPSHLTLEDLQDLDLMVVFDPPEAASLRQIARFVNGGGEAILVNLPNAFSGQTSAGRKVDADSTIFTMGNGKVIEIAGGIADPGKFSQDIRRLLGRGKSTISLWNASTIVAIPYKRPGASTATVELLNYAADAMPVQVRIQGSYTSVRFETPEHGEQILTPTHQDGCTQFDVPWLRIGGRVQLGASAAPPTVRA